MCDNYTMFTPTNRRATGRTWIGFGRRSSYVDLGKPGATPLAVVTRVSPTEPVFDIEIRGQFAERFVPPTRRRAADQAEARALELL